jgi:hypothetical protein
MMLSKKLNLVQMESERRGISRNTVTGGPGKLQTSFMRSSKRGKSPGNKTFDNGSPRKPLKGHRKVENSVINLVSPTSISMKNSFLIKNADTSFDSYYGIMKKRKSLPQNPIEA